MSLDKDMERHWKIFQSTNMSWGEVQELTEYELNFMYDKLTQVNEGRLEKMWKVFQITGMYWDEIKKMSDNEIQLLYDKTIELEKKHLTLTNKPN